MRSFVRFNVFLFAVMAVFLFFACRSQPEPVELFPEPLADETAAVPEVRPPVFNITSIAILKAELINTRFRVGLRIDNPNHFPVELSSFRYALYGNGMLWAEGLERNVFSIPANSSLTGNVFLVMNFIDMNRALLDQIIRLESVNYRFAGDVIVSTGIDDLPDFKSSFSLSGYSEVLER